MSRAWRAVEQADILNIHKLPAIMPSSTTTPAIHSARALLRPEGKLHPHRQRSKSETGLDHQGRA